MTDQPTNLDEAMKIIRDKIMEDPVTAELFMALREREMMRTLADMLVEGRVAGKYQTEEVAVTYQGGEMLSLKTSNLPVENVPHECILLIVPDIASGALNLIVVGDPDQSWDVLQDSNKPDTTDPTSP